MDKRIPTLAQAVAAIPDGATVMIGGFGGSGAPIELIHALIDRYLATGSPKDLTVINNNAGNGHVGIAAMIEQGLVRKMICSFPRSADPKVFTEKYLAGEIELELVPQGTLAERIRAGGAGIPAANTRISSACWACCAKAPSGSSWRSAGALPAPITRRCDRSMMTF